MESEGKGAREPRYQCGPVHVANMSRTLSFLFVVLCIQLAEFSDPPPCVIELECAECVPDNMPSVESHAARDGAVRAPHGAELALACGGGKFLAYPLRDQLNVTCEAGRYRVPLDGALRHLLELGCQESVLEDVQHHVEHCGAPLQGRAYRARRARGGVLHLATLCYDADGAVAARLRVSNAPLPLPPHSDASAPLSLLGNFEHMFDARTRLDAERLFADDASLTRRLRELFKHESFTFADQTLTAARLLSARYFDGQHARAAEFASNKVGAWRSVARGNLRHVHADVGALLRRAPRRALDVYAGTHGVLALPALTPVYLKAGRRFPVPKYIWTVVVARDEPRGVALVVLNDPFVRVSEIREAVFCESACGALGWLAALRAHRNYERPIDGLVFCCKLQEFVAVVGEMPKLFNDTIQLLT